LNIVDFIFLDEEIFSSTNFNIALCRYVEFHNFMKKLFDSIESSHLIIGEATYVDWFSVGN
jgi:hypothetical protein